MKKGIKSILLFLVGLCIGYLINQFTSTGANFSESFWIGVLSCICIGFILISIHLRAIKPRNKQLLVSIYFVGTLFVGATVVIITVNQLNNKHIFENNQLEKNNQIQENIANSSIEIKKLDLVNLLLKEISDEAKQSEERSLSPNTLKRVIQLSKSLYPFYVYSQDTLSNKKLSPGRGQLLLGLAFLNIDSSDFSYLIKRSDFSYSLLKDVDLSGLVLNGINLQNALIINLILNSNSFENSNFENSSIVNTDFKNSNLRNTSFKFSNLKWNNFNGSNLTNSNFTGISGYNNYFNKTILRKSSFQWAELESNQFVLADLEESDLWGANLTRANFLRANLKNTRLLDCNLFETNFSKSNLINSAVSRDWLKKAIEILNYEEILTKYTVIADSSERFKRQNYFIRIK